MSTYSNVRNLTKDQRKFSSLYKKLSTEQQDVLKMLSVIYEQVSRTKVCSCLKRAGIRSKKGEIYTNSQLNIVIKILGKTGLVDFNNRGVLCDREIVELVTRKALADDSFEKMAWAVKTELKAQQAWSMRDRTRGLGHGVKSLFLGHGTRTLGPRTRGQIFRPRTRGQIFILDKYHSD